MLHTDDRDGEAQGQTRKRTLGGANRNWAVQNENVVTSRRVGFVSSGRCLESGMTAVVAVERSPWLQETTFPQMDLQKNIRDRVQYD